MDYGKIVSRAWNITWTNKYLWLLGFLIALGGGAGNGANFNFSSGQQSGGSRANLTNPEGMEAFFRDFYQQNETLITTLGVTLIIFFCGLMLFSVVMWFIRFVAEAGLIQTTVDIENGQVSTFSKAMSAGRPFLFPLFITKLILYSPLILIVGFTLLSLVAVSLGAGSEAGSIILVIALCFFTLICFFIIPYNIVALFVYPFAARGIVLRGLGAMESLRYGWNTLKNHFVDVFILGIIYFMMHIVVNIASVMVGIPLLLLSAGPALYNFYNGQIPGVGSILLVAIGVIVFIFVSAAIASVFLTFRSVAFTLAYLEWGNKEKLGTV